MKREIKFKAKRVDNVEWVKGYYFAINNDTKHYIRPDYSLLGDVEVHPETVCQFTGLKDVNGVDIYESDHDNEGAFVTFCPVCNGWQFGAIDLQINEIFINCHSCDGNFVFTEVTDFKVTGNIHDQTPAANV